MENAIYYLIYIVAYVASMAAFAFNSIFNAFGIFSWGIFYSLGMGSFLTVVYVIFIRKKKVGR